MTPTIPLLPNSTNYTEERNFIMYAGKHQEQPVVFYETNKWALRLMYASIGVNAAFVVWAVVEGVKLLCNTK